MFFFLARIQLNVTKCILLWFYYWPFKYTFYLFNVFTWPFFWRIQANNHQFSDPWVVSLKWFLPFKIILVLEIHVQANFSHFYHHYKRNIAFKSVHSLKPFIVLPPTCFDTYGTFPDINILFLCTTYKIPILNRNWNEFFCCSPSKWEDKHYWVFLFQRIEIILGIFSSIVNVALFPFIILSERRKKENRTVLATLSITKIVF